MVGEVREKQKEVSMRRKDREMSREFGLTVIDKAAFGVLSTVDDKGMPYGIALSIVRDNDRLYVHSAKAGTKVELLTPGTPVCVTFVTDVEVPELYSKEELEEMKQDESLRLDACLPPNTPRQLWRERYVWLITTKRNATPYALSAKSILPTKWTCLIWL